LEIEAPERSWKGKKDHPLPVKEVNQDAREERLIGEKEIPEKEGRGDCKSRERDDRDQVRMKEQIHAGQARYLEDGICARGFEGKGRWNLQSLRQRTSERKKLRETKVEGFKTLDGRILSPIGILRVCRYRRLDRM
jgi:hypothetical protein